MCSPLDLWEHEIQHHEALQMHKSFAIEKKMKEIFLLFDPVLLMNIISSWRKRSAWKKKITKILLQFQSLTTQVDSWALLNEKSDPFYHYQEWATYQRLRIESFKWIRIGKRTKKKKEKGIEQQNAMQCELHYAIEMLVAIIFIHSWMLFCIY